MKYRIFILISLLLFLSLYGYYNIANNSSRKTVFIYNGPGVFPECFEQAKLALEKKLPPCYTVLAISPEEVIKDSWEKKAALFVLPGGADIPYTEALNGTRNQKIMTYVKKGGSFLGICAGSYYAGQFVDFAKDTPLEVQGKRELGFFQGTVEGPILAPYDYLTKSSARSAKLIWNGEDGFPKGTFFTVYYNGGGYFVGAQNHKNVSVLAFYDTQQTRPAIIECRVGKGKAILSGPHFEYNPYLLDSKDPYLQKILPDLTQGNDERELLLKHLLNLLL